jgi:hypothetical protein
MLQVAFITTLKSSDFCKRHNFAKDITDLDDDERFLQGVHVSSLIHGYNVRICSWDNPHVFIEYQCESLGVNIWHTKGCIPFFFMEPT